MKDLPPSMASKREKFRAFFDANPHLLDKATIPPFMIRPTANDDFVRGTGRGNVNPNMQQSMLQRYRYNKNAVAEYETVMDYNARGEPVLVHRRKNILESEGAKPHTASFLQKNVKFSENDHEHFKSREGDRL